MDTCRGTPGQTERFLISLSFTAWKNTVVLILSFTPDVLLAWSHNMGASWSEDCALMTMHVVVWALCVALLPALAIAKHLSENTGPGPATPVGVTGGKTRGSWRIVGNPVTSGLPVIRSQISLDSGLRIALIPKGQCGF